MLAPELAAAISADRFERELRLAASLQQANILPVIAAGDVDGLPYYTMPYVEGESLRARLGKGALPIGESIDVWRDVAKALAYANGHGIVHRDIKPDNVLLSGHSAVGSAHKRLGELYEAKGDNAKAVSHSTAFIRLWARADPDRQPEVAEVRARLERLRRTLPQ